MLIFRVLSALLSYPTAEMRAALPEMAEVVRDSPLIAPTQRGELLALIENLSRGDLLDAEEGYSDLFDRGRALSLHLFEHLHGDSRDRGSAMVELKDLYRGDHGSFWQAGYPAAMLNDTSVYRQTHYHCLDGPDTTDRLSTAFSVGIIQAAVGSAARMLRSDGG